MNTFFRDPFTFCFRFPTVFLEGVTDRRWITKAQVDAKLMWNCPAVLFINFCYVAKKGPLLVRYGPLDLFGSGFSWKDFAWILIWHHWHLSVSGCYWYKTFRSLPIAFLFPTLLKEEMVVVFACFQLNLSRNVLWCTVNLWNETTMSRTPEAFKIVHIIKYCQTLIQIRGLHR